MKTVRKVVITHEEWKTLADAADLLETWFKEATKEDYKAIEEVFETIGDEYCGYSIILFIRNTLNDVCEEIEVEDED
jgi:hypothetical protein